AGAACGRHTTGGCRPDGTHGWQAPRAHLSPHAGTGAVPWRSVSDAEETKHANTDGVGVHVAGRRQTGAGGKDEDRDGGCEHGGWTWLTGTTNIGKTFRTLRRDVDAS